MCLISLNRKAYFQNILFSKLNWKFSNERKIHTYEENMTFSYEENIIFKYLFLYNIIYLKDKVYLQNG